jgi:hypothetical protein
MKRMGVIDTEEKWRRLGRARARDSTENVEATGSSPEDMRITWVSLSLSLSLQS